MRGGKQAIARRPVAMRLNRPTPEQLLGIEVVAIRWSAQTASCSTSAIGWSSREKALPLMDHSIKPYLIEEASGARFGIPSSPKVGPMRQTTRRPEAGRVYWMLFGNPARYIKPGNLVTRGGRRSPPGAPHREMTDSAATAPGYGGAT